MYMIALPPTEESFLAVERDRTVSTQYNGIYNVLYIIYILYII